MKRLHSMMLAGFCCLAWVGAAAAQSEGPVEDSKKDPFDVLKNIPLSPDGSIKLSIGGQLRIRSELSRHPVFGLAEPDRNNGLLVRSSISADLQLGPNLRTFIEVVSGQAPVWANAPPASQLDRLDLLQGYGELALPTDVGRFMIRAGRQEMSFGSSRLVSVRESPNIHRTFDGVRVAWIAAPDTRIDAFLTRPVALDTGLFDDKSDPTQTFWGVYGTAPVPGVPALKANLYYFGLNREDARFAQGKADEHRHTVGTRLFGKAKGFDWNFEAAYQFGNFGRADIQAWTISGEVGYSLASLPFSPRISLNADVISGDHNLRDGRLGTFNPLFPKLPYFSEANLTAPANLIDIQPKIALLLLPQVTLTVGWNPLWKQAEVDAFYGPAVTPVARTQGGTGRYIGQQISTSLEWSPTDHLTFGGTYVSYRPGNRIREVGGKSGSFAAGWATVSF